MAVSIKERDCDTAAVRWARDTGPDLPLPTKGILTCLAENCNERTGVVSVSYMTVAGHFRQGMRWAHVNVTELKPAGMVRGRRTGRYPTGWSSPSPGRADRHSHKAPPEPL